LKGGRYENVERGNANTALIHFTGGVSFSEEPSKMSASAIFQNVDYALVKQHGLVSCITPVGLAYSTYVSGIGLDYGLYFYVIGFACKCLGPTTSKGPTKDDSKIF